MKDIKYILENSNSQAKQDVFAYFMLEKDDGYFLDFGASEPILSNNTYLLERLGWKGFCFDMQKFDAKYRETRKAPYISCNLIYFDVLGFLRNKNVPNVVDYMSIDLDESTERFLFSFPFDLYEFKVITLEHDSYRFGPGKKYKFEEFMKSKGYTPICNNVSVRESDVMIHLRNGSKLYPFEDWYVNEKYFDSEKLDLVRSENIYYEDIIQKMIL